jgi:hypothetical protein
VPFTKTFNPGEILTAADVNEHLLNGGYQYRETVYYTSSGTFSKADFPWLRAIRVRCQGGGGAGGGRNTSGASAGGGGGGYAEKFITDIAGLPSTVTVTRGAGGASVSTTTTGNAGVSSVFDPTGLNVIGAGGGGGGVAGGGTGGGFSNADFGASGSSGASSLNGLGTGRETGASGGGSHLGGGGSGASTGNSNGSPGLVYGGGGGGAATAATDPRTSGSGANGIVIVDLFA